MVEIAGDSPVMKIGQRKKRGRKPKLPLTREVELAYGHLYDLDWLQESGLAQLPAVQERKHRHNFIPEAQALRELLIEAASRSFSTSPKLQGWKVWQRS